MIIEINYLKNQGRGDTLNYISCFLTLGKDLESLILRVLQVELFPHETFSRELFPGNFFAGNYYWIGCQNPFHM